MLEQLVYASPIVRTAVPVLLFSLRVPAGEPTVVPSRRSPTRSDLLVLILNGHQLKGSESAWARCGGVAVQAVHQPDPLVDGDVPEAQSEWLSRRNSCWRKRCWRPGSRLVASAGGVWTILAAPLQQKNSLLLSLLLPVMLLQSRGPARALLAPRRQ